MTLTILLIGLTCLISIPAFSNGEMKYRLLHYPYLETHNGEWYRILTSGFIHADWVHLFINMFVLYQFGGIVESIYVDQLFGPMWGRVLFLVMYLVGIVFANLPSLGKHKDNQRYSALGASGAVSGVLYAYILFAPWSMLGLFGIIPVPAIVFGVLYLIYSSYAAKHSRDNIGHDAHFYGALFGFFFTLALKPALFSAFLSKVINGLPF